MSTWWRSPPASPLGGRASAASASAASDSALEGEGVSSNVRILTLIGADRGRARELDDPRIARPAEA